MRACCMRSNLYDMLDIRYCLILFYLFEFGQNVRNKAMLYIQNNQPGDKTKGDFHFFPFLKSNWYEKNCKAGSGHRCSPG
jgi:hypothetical protein